ncbi:hypothetical protein [Geothrix sp. SG200]|uniref:hypothetical protein n=1 Tax=Geothrix sp. SG200 TaxID=2922865 RepID=UPI001FADA959|nr:hypothetical protein [Geothrix sp. SG200]
MPRRVLIWLVILLLGPPFLRAQEFRVGAGVFLLAERGQDFQISLRPAASPWQVGFRHVQWRDHFNDPFTGRRLTETTETRSGPLVNYLFSPQSPGSWYLGGAVFRWSKREESLMTGEVSRAATTAPFIGGGYTRVLGRHGYFNLGLYLSPGAELSTKTSVSSEDDSGAFDIQIQLGARF